MLPLPNSDDPINRSGFATPAKADVQSSRDGESPATASPVGNETGGKKKVARLRILLVEDDPLTAKTITRLLEDEGYAAQSVASYKEALQMASQWLPDVLISDIGLPGKDGLEVMKTMRRAYPSLKGFVVSGYASPEDVESSREAGFAEHLAKPVSIDELRAALKRLLA